MWASQMSKTQLSLCLLSYVIAETAGPCLYVMPTLSMAETFSKDRLAPALRDTPILRGRVADPKSRDSGNTILHRRFNGGSVSIVGSNSPAGLASRAIRYLWLDEVRPIRGECRQRGLTDRSCHRTHTERTGIGRSYGQARLRLPMQA